MSYPDPDVLMNIPLPARRKLVYEAGEAFSAWASSLVRDDPELSADLADAQREWCELNPVGVPASVRHLRVLPPSA